MGCGKKRFFFGIAKTFSILVVAFIYICAAGLIEFATISIMHC